MCKTIEIEILPDESGRGDGRSLKIEPYGIIVNEYIFLGDFLALLIGKEEDCEFKIKIK